MRRIAEFRKEHEKLVKGLLPDNEKVAFTEGNIVNVLANKDHLGRRVLVVNSGKLWNPDEVSADQLFRLFYLSKFRDRHLSSLINDDGTLQFTSLHNLKSLHKSLASS